VVGLTQAERVSAPVRSRLLASLTVTQSLTPSKERAEPNLPLVVQPAQEMVPALLLPDESATG